MGRDMGGPGPMRGRGDYMPPPPMLPPRMREPPMPPMGMRSSAPMMREQPLREESGGYYDQDLGSEPLGGMYEDFSRDTFEDRRPAPLPDRGLNPPRRFAPY
ncbi:hypothetical protein B566_EDAN008021 [Ephemera danica]|nr:hypothetical protein B566_EDAN008021 [Ephemera danica]